MIVAKYPFRNGLPRFGAIVLAMQDGGLFPECPLGSDGVYLDATHLELARECFRRIGRQGCFLAGDLVATAPQFKAHRPPNISTGERAGNAGRIPELNRVAIRSIGINFESPPVAADDRANPFLKSRYELVSDDVAARDLQFFDGSVAKLWALLVSGVVLIVEAELMAVDDEIDVFRKPLDNAKRF